MLLGDGAPDFGTHACTAVASCTRMFADQKSCPLHRVCARFFELIRGQECLERVMYPNMAAVSVKAPTESCSWRRRLLPILHIKCKMENVVEKKIRISYSTPVLSHVQPEGTTFF